jgi:nicotinic acid mononucleotide adenylyltransferase
MLDEEDKKDDKEKRKSFKEFDPSKYVDIQPTLDEAKAGTVVFAWGRMNPMTAGHEKLVKKVIAVAKTEKGTPQIYLSHSQGAKTKTGKGAVNKDPLAYDDKIKFAQKAFGPVVKKSPAKTIIQLLKLLDKQFDRVIFVAGSDRVKEFNNTLNKYNGTEYKFSELKVVSAGQRDEDADDVSGISGTKMRGYAKTDMKKFTANLPKKLKGDAEEIAALVNKGTQMTEESNLDEVLTRQQRHKKSIAMRRARHKIKRGREIASRKRASDEKLQGRAKKKALQSLKDKFAKHKRYADMEPAEKINIEKKIAKIPKARIERIAKRLLPAVKKAEREKFSKAATDNPTTPKKESTMPSFKDFVNNKNLSEMWGQRVSARPHMLMDKNMKTKFDKRFKMYKKPEDTPIEKELEESVMLNDILDLVESTESYIKQLDEAKFSPKEVKMAIGIASDKRYKGGNYSGAVKMINKIKDGLADHPQVAAVLKRQNETKSFSDYTDERRKAIKKAVNTEPTVDETAGEEGTNKLVSKYKKDTPNA